MSPLRRATIVLRALLALVYPFALYALLRRGALALDTALALQLLPAAMSALVGLLFAWTLRPGAEPMITRVARALERDEIPARILPFLRSATLVWCAFLAANAAIIALLALFAPLAAWALWTGALAYVCTGALLLGEYVVRKIRFRWYRDGTLDRIWCRVFPPFPASPAAGPPGRPAEDGERSSIVT